MIQKHSKKGPEGHQEPTRLRNPQGIRNSEANEGSEPIGASETPIDSRAHQRGFRSRQDVRGTQDATRTSKRPVFELHTNIVMGQFSCPIA